MTTSRSDTNRRSTQRRTVLRAGVVLFASLVIPPARACEYFTGTLRIMHPWTRATSPDAASAVLCMKFDEVSVSDRLIRVDTPVANSAELIVENASAPVNVLIPEGHETVLSEEGTHIRLLGLKHPLFIGRSYPLQLSFEKSGTVNATLNVDYGGAMMPFTVRRF
jgi:copper(I)-binding protein